LGSRAKERTVVFGQIKVRVIDGRGGGGKERNISLNHGTRGGVGKALGASEDRDNLSLVPGGVKREL